MRSGDRAEPRRRRTAADAPPPVQKRARCRVRNPFGLFVGALWMTFATGLRPDRHHFHCWDEIDVASYVRRMTQPPSCGQTPFWRRLSETVAGWRSSTCLTARPMSRSTGSRSSNGAAMTGISVSTPGQRRRPRRSRRRSASIPCSASIPIRCASSRPTTMPTAKARSARSTKSRTCSTGCSRGVGAKRKLSSALLADGGWDLFLTVFGESQRSVTSSGISTTRPIRASIPPWWRLSAAIRSRRSTASSTPRSAKCCRWSTPRRRCSCCSVMEWVRITTAPICSTRC